MAVESARPSAERIARSYYLISGLYTLSASMIWGINTLFLLNAGLSLFHVFVANAVFTGSMAVFEVPTGLVADARGRRLSFLLSVAVIVLGTLAYVAIPMAGGGFLAFCLASVVLGLGYTFYSGATEAWLVDALNATGYDEPVDGVLARGAFISSAAMLAGTVGGGLLGSIQLAVPYLVRCGFLLVAFGVAFVSMHDTGFTVKPLKLSEVPREMAAIGRDSIRFGWQEPRARLAILAGAMPAAFLEWGYHGWQPYFLGLLGSKSTVVAGFIAAAIALAMMAGNAIVERLTRVCGRRTSMLLLAAIAYSGAAIGVGLAHVFWLALLLYLVSMAASGVFQPVRQGYLHQVVPREQRATVLSLASLASSSASASGQLGLGYVAARTQMATGYVVGGAITALAVPFVLAMRRIGGSADKIIGQAGRYSGCATLALPEGVAVAAEREVDVEVAVAR